MSDAFELVPFQPVSEPRQLKAFADPLRVRLLHILSAQEATNQQLATAVGEPPAKVLHHVRFLVDAGLVRLVDERIVGGNVEKRYRATARLYGLRAEPRDEAMITGAVFEGLLQEIVASTALWPDDFQRWETRRARLSPERLEAFQARLLALIEEYWGGLDGGAPEDADADLMALATVVFRYPVGELTPESTDEDGDGGQATFSRRTDNGKAGRSLRL